MSRFAMDIEDQWVEFLLEAQVIVRAAQTALVSKLVKRDAANGTSFLVKPGQFFGSLSDGHLLHHSAADRGSTRFGIRLGEIIAGMILTEVQFLRLAAGEFRDVERRRFIALLTLHG